MIKIQFFYNNFEKDRITDISDIYLGENSAWLAEIIEDPETHECYNRLLVDIDGITTGYSSVETPHSTNYPYHWSGIADGVDLGLSFRDEYQTDTGDGYKVRRIETESLAV